MGCDLVKAVEVGGDSVGIGFFGKRGISANVDEQNRELVELPSRRSKLVSKRAEIWVLSRRANLQHAKRNGANSQERNQTFFATFVRRQLAIKAPGHASRTQPLSDRDEKLLHASPPQS